MFCMENLHKTSDNFSGGFKLKFPEQTQPLKWEFWMFLKDESGHILSKRHGNNIIVNTASILKSSRNRDKNLQNPPQPTTAQTTLENEIARKAFTSPDVTFVDPETGDPTMVPTNVLDFTATFAETEAVGPIVEMGLFGGDATDLLDSGSQVNYRTFPVLNKTNSMTLTIIFRITA